MSTARIIIEQDGTVWEWMHQRERWRNHRGFEVESDPLLPNLFAEYNVFTKGARHGA